VASQQRREPGSVVVRPTSSGAWPIAQAAPGPHACARIAALSATSRSVAGPSGVRVARHAEPSREKRSVGSPGPRRWIASVRRRSTGAPDSIRRASGSIVAEPTPCARLYDGTDAAERIRAPRDADEARWVERQVEIDADIRAAYAARLELG